MSDPAHCRHSNSLVIRAQRDVTYKRKQQVGYTPTGWYRLQPSSLSLVTWTPDGATRRPRHIKIQPRDINLARAPMPTIIVISLLNYHINRPADCGGRGSGEEMTLGTSGHFSVAEYLDLYSSPAWERCLLLTLTMNSKLLYASQNSTLRLPKDSRDLFD